MMQENRAETEKEETELERLREENLTLRALLSEQEQVQERFSATNKKVVNQASELVTTRNERDQQARLFDTVLSSIVDFAYVYDREGRFTYVNQALLDLWQLNLEDALGKNFFELNYPPELASRLQQQIETVFTTGETLRDETSYTAPDGTAGYYEYIFVPVFAPDGRVEVVAGSTRDISQRHQEQIEKETLLTTLKIERERLTSLIQQAPAFIAVLRGPEHIFERANPPYYQLIGSGRDILGKSVREALPEVEGQGFLELLDEVFRTGKPFIGKDIRILLHPMPGQPLQVRYLDFVYQPLVEADGSISGIFVHGVDLTERKQAEEKLQERSLEIEALNVRLRRSMKETHHRVKNNLQVIAALVEIQADELGDTRALQRIKQHVRALASLHDLLTRQANLDQNTLFVSAADVLENLIPILQATSGDRHIRSNIDQVLIPVQKATSLSLLVSETVSNAIKHAYGEVEITLTAEQDKARLEIADDGVGFPAGFDPRKSANIGLDLIESTARWDLRGEVSYENRSQGGARVVVTFPLPSATEDIDIEPS